MKKLSKGTTIAASIIICLLLVVGFIFSFVPMTFGSNKYVSLFGSINIAPELSGAMYGEYDISTPDPTESQLVKSMDKIKQVFEDDGYRNVNVYSVGKSKIRVEVSFPTGNKSYSDVYSDLSIVSSGSFSLTSNSSSSGSSSGSTSEVVRVIGSEHVKEVKVSTNTGNNYISIVFNKAGREKYEELCKATTTIYMNLGTYNQSINAENVQDYSSFTLSDKDYANLKALQKRIIIGCMDIEINSSTAVINTMSSNTSPLGNASSPEEKGFKSSPAKIVLISAVAIAFVAAIAFFAVKFGLYAIAIAISMLLNVYLTLVAFCLVPSVEIGFSVVLSLILGYSVIYTFAYIFASTVKSEYNEGKSFGASLESAFKKTFAGSLISSIALFLSSLIVIAFSFGEITSSAIAFAICAFLGILTNFAILPFIIKVGISYEKIGPRLFMLKKRKMGFESSDKTSQVEKKESV